MINPHIVRKITSPISAPPEAGIHWINTATGEEFFSVGTSNVNDWVIRKNNGDWLNGSGVPSNSIGNDNDNYINNDNGDYYKKVSGVWVIQGSLKGPEGEIGPEGDVGPAGADGSQIYTGTIDPSPLLGQDSDFYINSSTNAYYQKLSGSWLLIGSFAGVTDHGLLTGLSDNDHPQYLLTSNFDTQNEAMKEPTGFPNRTDSAITFDDFTRTLFISATGASFDVWIKGTLYTFPSLVAIGKQISTTAGNHYLYFDASGNLEETTTFSVDLFQDNAMVAIVYWNPDTNTHTYLGDERHGMQMDGATHGYLHTVFGTRYLTGLALQGFEADGDGSSNAHAQFTSDSGTIRDEDLLLSILDQSQIPVLFRQGSLWRKKAGDSYPIIYNGTAGYTGTRVPFNEFVTGNWQLTQITNGNYVLVHYFATNDQDNPVIGIMGINQYPNAPQARAACETEIGSLSGLPFAEFTAIGSVIFQSNSAYTNTPKAIVVSSNPTIGEIYVDFRGEQLYTPSGVATSHSLLSNLNSDDHLQYFTESRGDARYLKLTGGVISGAASTGSSLLRVTNTGTGDSFVVEDAANPDASNFKIDANGFIFTGSLLSTVGSSGRLQILDSQNAFVECIAGSTRAVSFGASTTGNRFSSAMGSFDISTTDSGDAISVTPSVGDELGPSIYSKSNGTSLLTGINNNTPAEALDVNGNFQANGNIKAISGTALSLISASGFISEDSSVASVSSQLTKDSLSIQAPDGLDFRYFNASPYNVELTNDTDSLGIFRTYLEPARIRLYNAISGIGQVPTTPVDPEEVTTKHYTDATFAPLAGATFTGAISATNLSGTNTGDEDSASIKTKLGAASSSNDGYLTTTDYDAFNESSYSVKYQKSVYYVTPTVASTTPSTVGCPAPSFTGTAGGITPTCTSLYTSKKIMALTASAISTAIAGWRWATETFIMGSTTSYGGFKFSTSLGFTQGFAVGGTNRRFFVGFTNSTVAPTDVQPSSLTNMFGFGLDNGDSTIQFMSNDGAGIATKINTGLPRPTTDQSDFYKIEISVVAGSGVVQFKISNHLTGASFSDSTSVDLPLLTELLSPRAWMSAGGVSTALGISFDHIYIEN